MQCAAQTQGGVAQAVATCRQALAEYAQQRQTSDTPVQFLHSPVMARYWLALALRNQTGPQHRPARLAAAAQKEACTHLHDVEPVVQRYAAEPGGDSLLPLADVRLAIKDCTP
jgi:hypothetical protein